jgi:hypothetical protein
MVGVINFVGKIQRELFSKMLPMMNSTPGQYYGIYFFQESTLVPFALVLNLLQEAVAFSQYLWPARWTRK